MKLNTLPKEVAEKELLDLFEAYEGSVNMYYGQIGNGKTYSATADVMDLLKKGQVVYANWHIEIEDFDERRSLMHVLMKTVFWRKRFYKFPKENLHYFNVDELDDPIAFLAQLTDCHVFIDEGQWIFDSYEGTKFSKAKRRVILHTRHYNRSLNIISQRTNAIQVSARGQVNRFYKCQKKLHWPFLIFRRTEFQEMKDNDVDEASEPISQKTYFANKKVLNAYNSLYLRGGIERSQQVFIQAWDYSFLARLILLFSFSNLPALRQGVRNAVSRIATRMGVKSSLISIKTSPIQEKSSVDLAIDRLNTPEKRKGFIPWSALKESLQDKPPF